MRAPPHRLLSWLLAALLLVGTTGLLGRAAAGERPPIDREEHAKVQTATFALG